MVSDEQLKEAVLTVNNTNYELLGLRGVEWDWNQQAYQSLRLSGKSYGVIAQEVEQVYPWLVQKWPDGYKRVNYGLLNVMVYAAKWQALFLWWPESIATCAACITGAVLLYIFLRPF